MANFDDELLIQWSDEAVFDHIDDKDPRLSGSTVGVSSCAAVIRHQTNPESDPDDDTERASDQQQQQQSPPLLLHCHASILSEAADDANHHKRQAMCRLGAVAALCFLFMTAEAVGGFIANSLAIMSDAAHLLSDLASFIVSIVALRLSLRPATATMTFGYHRTEVVGAAVSVLTIWLVTGVLVYLAACRISSGHYEVQSDSMLLVAGLGVVVNIVMAAILHGSCGSGVAHNHSHGGLSAPQHTGSSHATTTRLVTSPAVDGHRDCTSSVTSLTHSSAPPTTSATNNNNTPHHHQHQQQQQRHLAAERNINIRAALVHVLGDWLQSVGVLVAAIVIKIRPDYQIIDPLCTFVFSVIVVFTTVGVARDVSRILLEATPRGLALSEVTGLLCSVPGVLRVHSVNVWSLSVQQVAMTAHVVKCEGHDSDTVLSMVLSALRTRHPQWLCTVQVESFQPVMNHCSSCHNPPSNP